MGFETAPKYTWDLGSFDNGLKMGEEWQRLYDNLNRIKIEGYDVHALKLNKTSPALTTYSAGTTGIKFNADGTKLFVLSYNSTPRQVSEYALSTAYDVSTAVYVQSFSVATQDGTPRGLEFSPDGTKMFIVGDATNKVYRYDLTTGFDISTASYTSFFDISTYVTNPTGLHFKEDGSQMFIVDYVTCTVTTWVMSPAFDITTSLINGTKNLSTIQTDMWGVYVDPTGTKLITYSIADTKFYEYYLPTAFDITFAYLKKSADFAYLTTSVVEFIFSSDGAHIYLASSNNHRIYDLFSHYLYFS